MSKTVKEFLALLALFILTVGFSYQFGRIGGRSEKLFEHNSKRVPLVVGKPYLSVWSYSQDDKDPFQKKIADTVVVDEIKDGYVKYHYRHLEPVVAHKDTVVKFQSCKVYDLEDDVIEIK